MDAFNFIAGLASIIALLITIWQQHSINKTKQEVNDAINKVRELHKRAALHSFLGFIREITKELTAITNATAKGKYRGGRGNELKTRLENFIGDLLEASPLLTNSQCDSIKSLENTIKTTDFNNIESNTTATREIMDKFSQLRQDFSAYLSPHTTDII